MSSCKCAYPRTAQSATTEAVIAKAKLGTKQTCPACSTAFYDMNASDVVCPHCGAGYLVLSGKLQATPADDTYTQPSHWLAGSADTHTTNVFLTGRAGTGKTTLLKRFLEIEPEHTVVLAPTGVAAMHVGGQTIHSFFKFPPRLLDASDVKRLRNARLVKKIKTMVIDEISMVRSDMLDAIDQSLRLNRGNKRPFGGVRMILSGDLHQLPPVVRGEESELLNERYGGAFFHKAPAFKNGDFSLVALKHIFRQQEEDFLNVLNHLRAGKLTVEDEDVLEGRVADRSAIEASETHTVLTPNNASAFRINQARLNELIGDVEVFEATIEGDFDDRSQPTEASLELKIGARIMIIKNDPDGRWINGSIGLVEGFDDGAVFVSLDGETHKIEPTTWEKYRYQVEPGSDEISRSIVGAFKQLPLRLAYAVTIHKAQGLTLDKVYIDFDRGMFAHGQAYVALSRARNLAGLELSRPLRPRDIVFDRAAFDFGKLDVVTDTEHYMLARFQPPEGQLV